MAPYVIVPLTPADIPQAVECIQTVFAEDPFFCYMFDPYTYNLRRNAASLTAHFLHGLHANAPIYVAKTTSSSPQSSTEPKTKSSTESSTEPKTKSSTESKSTSTTSNTSKGDRVVGVCWWMPPQPLSTTHSATPWADWLLSFRQLLANIRYGGRGGLHLPRYLQWKSLQAETHDELWTDPRGYYFCNVIAVREEMRGQGVGRKLVEVVTQRADAEGMPCYLESSKGMPNLLIYEKLGFESVGEIECVDGKEECTLYCMVREPVKTWL